MNKITAIIPTLNEESNIQRVLDSVIFANEILVIDSFSTDDTVKIVKEYDDVKLIQRTFDDFSSQRNFAMNLATNDWVLFVDADEEVSPALQSEIQQTLSQEHLKSAYKIKRIFFFGSEKVYFSGFRNGTVLRLLKKQDCTYYGKVHEQVSVSGGDIGKLKERLHHYSYTSYSQYQRKLEKYAVLQGQELFAKEKYPTPYHFIIKPLVRFMLHYFFKFGILDGKKGIILSFLHAKGVFLRYKELAILWKVNK